MLGKVFSASGIAFEADIDEIDDILKKDSEILLYRIVQECANNIVKHSKLKKRSCKIEREAIQLNGQNFRQRTRISIRQLAENDLSKRSFGLVGIAERTRLLGGKLNIESTNRKGTSVSIIH